MPNITDAQRLMYAYRASHVKRWHCQGHMIRSEDVGKHSHLVAQILLICHPDPSRNLLAAALVHDLGELRGGDVPRYAKRFQIEGLTIGSGHDLLEHEELEKYGLAQWEDTLNTEERMWLNAADAAAAWFVIYDNIVAGNSRCGTLYNRLWEELTRQKSKGTFPLSMYMLLEELHHFDLWNED